MHVNKHRELLKSSLLDTGLEFKPGHVSCVRSMCIEGSFDVSCKCYNVTFKLRAVAAAEGKSKEVLLGSLKWRHKSQVPLLARVAGTTHFWVFHG